MVKNVHSWLKVAFLGGVVVVLFLILQADSLATPQIFQPPLFNSPLPSPSPSPGPTPTIPPDLSNAEKAILWVSQSRNLPVDQLVMADSFVTELSLTGRVIWRGLVLDTKGKGQLTHEVLIDDQDKRLLVGDQSDADEMWEAEASAYQREYGDVVLKRIAEEKKTSPESLETSNGGVIHYPLTNQTFWRAKVLNRQDGAIYGVAIDAQGQFVDQAALEEKEWQARREKYGHLEPDLFYLLQAKQDDEPIEVLLWAGGVDYKWVEEELAKRYPDVRASRFASGRPVDETGKSIPVDKELSERIRADYNSLLDQTHLKAAEPIVDFLKARGYEAKALRLFPAVVAQLPKKAILELNTATVKNLRTIYWGDLEIRPQLESAAPTIRAPIVWDLGYTGQGVTVTILEGESIQPDITHNALQGKIVEARKSDPTAEHPASVAGVVASQDNRYRGIAPGVNLLSAGVLSAWSDLEDGLNWAIDRNSFVINASMSVDDSRYMQTSDRVFDYVVRERDATVVTVAGNRRDDWNQNWHVTSPGKAYNVITVGAFVDNNTSHWGDEGGVQEDSSFRDPYIEGTSSEGDREKPEVVAVGESVTSVDITQGDNGFWDYDGVSVAAPQVSGLAALLIERYFPLHQNPETVKAIIMASAVHGVEVGLPAEKSGVGAIDAASALLVMDRGAWAHEIIEDIDNWGDYRDLDSAFFDQGDTYAEAGERIRAVICWDSNPASDYSSDPLSTDFDLYVWDPNNNLIATSDSYNNNYEVVEFTASISGRYTVRVSKYASTGESGNLSLGVAWMRVPVYNVSFLGYDRVRVADPGSNLTIPIQVHNDGTKYWYPGQVFLSYHWVRAGYDNTPLYPTSPGMVTWEGVRTSIPNVMSFGDSAEFQVQVTVPSTSGSYVLVWDMVESGVTWFNWEGARVGRTEVLEASDHVFLPAVMRNY